MKTNNFDKLDAYTANGVHFIKFHMVGVMTLYIAVYLYLVFSTAADPDIWRSFMVEVSGGGIGFNTVYFALDAANIAVASVAAVMLPMVNKSSYRWFFAHYFSSVLVFPLILLLTLAFTGAFPKEFFETRWIPAAAWVVLNSGFAVYYIKRRDLFFSDIFMLVTGKPKDETAH